MTENDRNDKERFVEILNRFAEQYRSRNIKLEGTMVYIDGICKFNIDGYNLLYNLYRLCNALESQLR